MVCIFVVSSTNEKICSRWSWIHDLCQPQTRTLVDIAKGTAANGKVVLEHGSFSLAIPGFVPNTGRLLWANGSTITPITTGLNQPAGLKQADEHTWYVTNYGDSTVLKITN